MEIFCKKKRNLNGLLFYLWLFFFIRSLQKKKNSPKKNSLFSGGLFSVVFRRFPIDSKAAGHFPDDGLADCYLSISSFPSLCVTEREREMGSWSGILKNNNSAWLEMEKKKGKVFVFLLHLEMDPSNLSRELVSLYLFIWIPAATTTTSITTPFCC